MNIKVKTFEEFSGTSVKTPENTKLYLEYLKKEGRVAWLNKTKQV